MKRRLLWVGLSVLVLALVAWMGYGKLAQIDAEAQPQAQAWVDQNLPPILSTWDVDTLLQRASPALKAMADKLPLKQQFDEYRARLGVMTRYAGSHTVTSVSAGLGGVTVTGTSLIEAEFEKAPAQLRLSIGRDDGRWGIIGFQIHSDQVRAD